MNVRNPRIIARSKTFANRRQSMSEENWARSSQKILQKCSMSCIYAFYLGTAVQKQCKDCSFTTLLPCRGLNRNDPSRRRLEPVINFDLLRSPKMPADGR